MKKPEEEKKDIELREIRINIPETPKNERDDNINWNLGCFKMPKDCLVYTFQMIIISITVSVSLYNLSTSDEKLEFWASLLSGSVGYILPNPRLKK